MKIDQKGKTLDTHREIKENLYYSVYFSKIKIKKGRSYIQR